MPVSAPTPARRREEEIIIPVPRLRVLSLGAGVQSTTVLLMALCGELPDRLDCAIFADTGWEPKAVYEHLDWLEGKTKEGGIPVHRVSGGNLRQNLLDAVAGKRSRVANPPFFVRNRDGAGEYDTPDRGGMLWRKCTGAYKVHPIRSKIRALAEEAHGSARLPPGFVEQLFGISFDEMMRSYCLLCHKLDHAATVVLRRNRSRAVREV